VKSSTMPLLACGFFLANLTRLHSCVLPFYTVAH
jgi:hypothetical protein